MKWRGHPDLVAMDTVSQPTGEWKKLQALYRGLRGLELSEISVYLPDPDNSDLVMAWKVQGLVRRETLTAEEFEEVTSR